MSARLRSSPGSCSKYTPPSRMSWSIGARMPSWKRSFVGRAVGSNAENWRISREQHGGALRRYAATGLLVLLAVGHAPRMLNRFATDVHGGWRNGSAVPHERFVARLSLWPSLHGSLQEDLSVAAAEARNMRIGAEEKSDTLVRYARLMKPVSKPDANEIFNTAVEVASELDYEVIAQIRLLDQLVSQGGGRFTDARDTARKLGNIVADAAIRLDAHDHFPWEQAMAALARLDAPLALSNLARWDDEGIASLRETLTPALKTALGRENDRTCTGRGADDALG